MIHSFPFVSIILILIQDTTVLFYSQTADVTHKYSLRVRAVKQPQGLGDKSAINALFKRLHNPRVLKIYLLLESEPLQEVLHYILYCFCECHLFFF